jgi:hypothetical protein
MKQIILLLAILLGFNFNSFSQTYFDITKAFPGYPSYNTDFKTIQHYTPAQIKTAFDSICKSGIEFNYPQGGCQNRAQMMSMLLSKKLNIQHCKVWLFAPVDLIKGDKRTLTLDDKNGLAPNNIINWNYHVAPCVLVDNNKKVDTLIIDPSIDNKQPLNLSSWLKSIGNSDVSKYTFLSSQYYFFYTQDNGASTVINGYFYEYTATTYCTDVITDVTLEKGLAENDMVVYILNKYLKAAPIDNNRFNSFKPYFGEILVLENKFFSKVGYCGGTVSDNVSFRTLIENYPDIISDAMKFYYTRLIYWTQQSDKLRK